MLFSHVETRYSRGNEHTFLHCGEHPDGVRIEAKDIELIAARCHKYEEIERRR